MIHSPLSDLVPPLVRSYAETHYRFRFFPFSSYYRREPEIIFDAPHRLEPNQTLPVFLIIKDSDKFPLSVEHAEIHLSQDGHHQVEHVVFNKPLKTPLWWHIIEIDRATFAPGLIEVDCRLTVVVGKKKLMIRQDNHPGLSHRPLSVHLAAEPLPCLSGWHSGEIHCHTSYGTDQIEFGAPLEVIQRAAQACGLNWVALTDHSYDLDDLPDNYLLNDPHLQKWQTFQQHVKKLNEQRPEVTLIAGEEVSCRSQTGTNIHLLVLNNSQFIPGSGDSAQKWLQTRSELSVSEVLDRLAPEALAIAAHPEAPVSLMERFFVNRGGWHTKDLVNNKLSGWQIWNGTATEISNLNLKKWTNQLRTGEKIIIYAGNDAHGNFNRYRQVARPMLRLIEKSDHLFGKMTTRVKVDSPVTVDKLLISLKKGLVVCSDGPMIELLIIQENKYLESGSTADLTKPGSVMINYCSSPEFGLVQFVKILTFRSDQEITIKQYNSEDLGQSKLLKGCLKLPLNGHIYLRAELKTKSSQGKIHRALSNPIWLS